MNYWDKKAIRQQIFQRLESLKSFSGQGVSDQGWIKTIREALGMSARQLGRKTGIDQSRVSRLENAEADGSLKLSSLQKIARGLNMKFVYGFVPEESLEKMVRTQAEKIVLQRLKKLNQTMRLEDQKLSDQEREKAMQDMIEKILVDQPKDFWDQADE